ncbi:phosphatase PAP2 family protein [Segetibacter sp. 3557_3]|uniref:vanadium-dependent haloperoxidase n=1 Tax=Segetibacter sp. 3557_3 TaxID=2547429 RepID=UPI001058A03F|nr:vanadium-dependent haloperoxidase [Segetibacter sp. 3557_3]TDH24662.1 phosphatase PAP2 family protein [Segetibacter sp. 3557_3]
MKQSSLLMNRNSITHKLATVMIGSALFVACAKDRDVFNKNTASAHSSEVLDKWMTMQLRLMRNTPGITNQGFARPFAYSGIAAFESLKPGLNNSYRWSDRWNGLTGIPVEDKAKNYFLPANVNAALAEVNKALFPSATATDKAAIDSLENALAAEYRSTQTAEVIEHSSQYGKAVGAAVVAWAATDGASNASAPYTVPTGTGMWQPTAPQFSPPITPYWGNNRPVIQGSIAGAQPQPPGAYSADPSSPFYAMVKSVYDASQNLTTDQKDMAIFWRDVPGQTSPGHWLSILQAAIRSSKSKLDKAAEAYALTGSALNDALIACFAAKYQYNVVRPITYIRDIMGHTGWNTQIGTPAHPEYPSAHASLSAAAGEVLQELFGNRGTITDHTYDYMGLAPRSYPSFTAIGEEAGRSRLYGGIHYTQSIDAGFDQGRKVVANIFSKHK